MATAPKTTRIADDKTQDKPQTTTPGDAPADTFDPAERVSSAPTNKAAAATAGYSTVNAVTPTGTAAFPTAANPADTRTETYEQTGPDGKVYTVTHKLGTGETTVKAKA